MKQKTTNAGKTLWVGMQIIPATMKISMEGPQKPKTRTTI
jgi:hypothetical protein